MWQAWSLAKTYRCRPSDLYAIQDDFSAYCFDNAVALFGTRLEDELAAIDNDPKTSDNAKSLKRQRTFATWLGRKMQFRSVGPDPAKALETPVTEVSSDQTGIVSV